MFDEKIRVKEEEKDEGRDNKPRLMQCLYISKVVKGRFNMHYLNTENKSKMIYSTVVMYLPSLYIENSIYKQ